MVSGRTYVRKVGAQVGVTRRQEPAVLLLRSPGTSDRRRGPPAQRRGAGQTDPRIFAGATDGGGRLSPLHVFFTGTPHRGKEYGFLSLLKLLRSDLFDPDRPLEGQLAHLREVMIRNNKQNVADINGRRLFKPTSVINETYAYSPAEQTFYEMLTDFIVTGKAYAGTLGGFEGTAVGLVLVAMQKLASSLRRRHPTGVRSRLERIGEARREVDRLRHQFDSYRETESGSDLDEMAELEEKIASGSASLSLMQGEGIVSGN